MQLKTHACGMTYAVIPTGSPISSVSLWLRCGSRLDPEGKAGLAHFFEHVFLNKTVEQPDRIARLQRLATEGIEVSAYTTYETSHFQSVQLKEKTEAGVSFLLDCLKGFSVTEEDIEREKAVIIDESSREKEDPFSSMRQYANGNLWPNSTIANGILGSADSVRRIGQVDVLDFFKTYYKPTNATLLVIGDAVESEIEGLIGSYFPQTSQEVRSRQDLVELFAGPIGFALHERELENDIVAISFRGVGQTEIRQRVVLDLLAKILGDTWISRLTKRLRIERDLTYWIDAHTSNFSDTGYVRLQYSVKPTSMEESNRIIFDEINRLRQELVGEDELAAHKNLLITSLQRQSASLQDLTWNYGYQCCLTEGWIPVDEEVRLIREIKAEELKEVANRYLNDENRSIFVQGPA